MSVSLGLIFNDDGRKWLEKAHFYLCICEYLSGSLFMVCMIIFEKDKRIVATNVWDFYFVVLLELD